MDLIPVARTRTECFAMHNGDDISVDDGDSLSAAERVCVSLRSRGRYFLNELVDARIVKAEIHH
jgi:hypothetical protein